MLAMTLCGPGRPLVMGDLAMPEPGDPFSNRRQSGRSLAGWHVRPLRLLRGSQREPV